MVEHDASLNEKTLFEPFHRRRAVAILHLQESDSRLGLERSQSGMPLPIASRMLYTSPLLSVSDVVCSAGCGGGRHEEHCEVATLAFVRSGTFVRRDRLGRHVADATGGVLRLAEPYMVDHPVPGGDHCTSLRFEPRTLREAVRGARGGRIFSRSTLAGNAELHLAHFRLLEAVREGDPVPDRGDRTAPASALHRGGGGAAARGGGEEGGGAGGGRAGADRVVSSRGA